MKRMTYLSIAILLNLILAQSAWAGTVSGAVKFTGTAPESTAINMDADPTCLVAHADPVYADDVVVNGNGTLKNVFVYVKSGLEGQTFPPAAGTVTMDQNGCQYNPHVFGVQLGQDVEIMNSDPTLHNVHSMSKQSKEFNLGMPIQGMKIKRKFDKPEVMVRFKCDVHPWMGAYAGVLTHPFFSVSNDTGSFELKDLPAGTYEIEAWHEKYGTQTQSITVDAAGTQTTDFTFAG